MRKTGSPLRGEEKLVISVPEPAGAVTERVGQEGPSRRGTRGDRGCSQWRGSIDGLAGERVRRHAGAGKLPSVPRSGRRGRGGDKGRRASASGKRKREGEQDQAGERGQKDGRAAEDWAKRWL